MIELVFDDRYRDSLLNGSKTATIRGRKKGDVGDVFEAFGATFKIVGIICCPVDIAKSIWKYDGFNSEKDFLDTIKKYYPEKGAVWVHWIERV